MPQIDISEAFTFCIKVEKYPTKSPLFIVKS